MPNQLIDADVVDVADIVVKAMGRKEQLQQNSQQTQRENGQNKETVDIWEQTKIMNIREQMKYGQIYGTDNK